MDAAMHCSEPRSQPPNSQCLWPWLIWAGIVLLSAALRFTDLEHCPQGLFRDEAEKGFNAYALALEGGAIEFPVSGGGQASTQWNRWPYLIDVMGVKTSAIYQYASIPFMRLFGLSVGSARMAAAMAGTLTVALAGLLLLTAWPRAFALMAMAWLALCPWHYLFSRWALQAIFVPLGIVAALGGLWGVEQRRRWGAPLTGAALGFTFYAYSGAQPFILLWGLGLLVLYRRSIRERPWEFAFALALFLLGSLPRVWVILAEGGGARLGRIAVWNQPDATALLTLGRIARNYLAHFNPVFLFFSGDAQPRHSIPGLGQLLSLDLLFLPIGVFTSLRRGLPLARPLLLIFLLGPVGAAITNEGVPHALRSLPMVVPAALWGGLGLAVSAQWLWQRMKTPQVFSQGSGGSGIGRARIVTGLYVGFCFLFAGGIYQIYWQKYHEDPKVQMAFEDHLRGPFEQLFADRRPDQPVHVNGYILYGAYYALFFGKLPAEQAARQGLESLGFNFFNPDLSTPEQRYSSLVPGHWIIDHDGVRLTVRQKK